MTKKETASDRKHQATHPSHSDHAAHSSEPAVTAEEVSPAPVEDAPAPKHVHEAAPCQATSNRGTCGLPFGHAGHHSAKDNSHTWSR